MGRVRQLHDDERRPHPVGATPRLLGQEVWVNGEIPRRVGITSPATIQGFNIPNRVVIADAVKAGDKVEIAIFGINGPSSVVPPNFVFLWNSTSSRTAANARPLRWRHLLQCMSSRHSAGQGTGQQKPT